VAVAGRRGGELAQRRYRTAEDAGHASTALCGVDGAWGRVRPVCMHVIDTDHAD
jgi:hypothetical protein